MQRRDADVSCMATRKKELWCQRVILSLVPQLKPVKMEFLAYRSAQCHLLCSERGYPVWHSLAYIRPYACKLGR